MRIIYLKITEERISILSYSGDYTKKPKYKPNYHVATDTGIHISKECTNKNYLEIDTISFISFKFDVSKLVKMLPSLLEDRTRFILMNKDAREFIQYLKRGDTENGLKDSQFEDCISKIRELRAKMNSLKVDLSIFRDVSPEHFVTLAFDLLSNTDSNLTYTGKDYFKIPKFSHPFITGKYVVVDPRMFKDADGYHISCVNYPTTKELCRPLPDITESVITISELPEYLVQIIEKMVENMGDEKRVFIIPMASILDTFNIHCISDYSMRLMPSNTIYQFKLKTLAGVDIAYTPYPSALSTVIREHIEYYTNSTWDKVDLSPILYKSGKLDPDIRMSKHMLKVSIPYGDVVLCVGYDTPSRNVLKRIERQLDSITLDYTLENEIIKYRTTVTLKNGDNTIAYSPFNGYSFTSPVSR